MFTEAPVKLNFEDKFDQLIVQKLHSSLDSTKKGLCFVAINPPLIPESPFDIEVAKKQGYYNFPPTGPMYLCSSIDSLNLQNTSCEVIDLNNYLLKRANREEVFAYKCWTDAFAHLNEKSQKLIFLVSYMFGTTKECFTNTTQYIRSKYPDSLIITGGVQASFDKKEILDAKFADIVCTNEGDKQIQYIASKIHSKLFDYDTRQFTILLQGGINILSANNEIVCSGDVTQPADFDWNLDKYYDSIDIASYYKHGGLGAFSKFVESLAGKALPYSAVLTKRGCRAHCAFCTVRTFNGKGLRLRKLETVISEIRYLYSKGIRHIDWLDDDLLYDEKYNLQLFGAIKNEFPDLKWTASNGLIGVAITPALMQSMAESGLVAFKIGVESGNSQVIKDIRKPTTLWRLLDKSQLIREYHHIFFSANFIIGFPGETFKQMFDSFIFARKLECDWSSFYVCQPLKGTDLYSSFQHLMDPRAKEETYTKTINPGRSAARGEFAYSENGDVSEKLQAGWHIFDLPFDATFDAEAHNEIWFTFNLVANFFDNPCYKDIKFTKKLIHWLKAIHSGYPFDASMSAALSYCYRLVDEIETSIKYAKITEDLILNSTYWQNRVYSFPQILKLCSMTNDCKVCQKLNIQVPDSLIPEKYSHLFGILTQERELQGWK